MTLDWMAWTLESAIFFIFIFSSIVAMGIWEKLSPSGEDRKGIIGLSTSRGDRLFLSYLGSGFISLIWLYFFGSPLWGALIICLIYSVLVFLFV